MKALKLFLLATMLFALGFAQVGFAQTSPNGDGDAAGQELSVPVTGIALNGSGLELNVGDVGSLTAIIAPADATNKEVKWTSSNDEVASVLPADQANLLTVSVKAKAEGEAIITATTTDGSFTAISTVKVSKPAAKKVDELDLGAKSVTLLIGETKQVKLMAQYKDRSIEDVTTQAEWTSIPKTVADVNGGLITAKASGVAWVLASYGGEIVKLEVKVVAKRELKKLVAATDRVKMAVGDTKKVELKAIYTDGSSEDVTAKADWKSSDDTRVQVKEGQFTAIAAGKPVVTASFGGQSAVYWVEIKAASEKVLSKLEIRDEKGKRKSKLELKPGQTAAVKVVAIYKDKTETDVTNEAEWTNSKKNVADVDKGSITAKEKGVTTVRVSYNGKREQLTIQVKK